MVQRMKQETWNRQLFGIANADGKPWTYRVWGSQDAAEKYLVAKNVPPLDLSRHKVVPVSVTVRVPKHSQ